jgi:hypothetical protein
MEYRHDRDKLHNVVDDVIDVEEIELRRARRAVMSARRAPAQEHR